MSQQQKQEGCSSRGLAAQLIEEAVANKYAEVSDEAFRSIFDQAWERSLSAPDEAALVQRLRVLDGPEADVNNQVVVLQLIDRFWARRAVLVNPLKTIHSAVYGLNGEEEFRTQIDIEDFGGHALTDAGEVRVRLDELERVAQIFTSSLRCESRDVKAIFLAYIFTSVIRIHPFQDGNGRTARLFVQYALRCWDLPFLPLPKVRNDDQWKSALMDAIEGNATPLAGQFKERMKDRP